MHIENELLQDLAYVENLLIDTPEGTKRKQKMLKNHREFFQVLRFHKEKLRVLGIEGYEDQIKFDPKYNHY